MEVSNAVMTGIIPVCFRSTSVLFVLELTFSYMYVYFASGFDSVSDPLSMSICVYTQVGDSLVVDWVHRSCALTFADRETLVDLLVLDMVDFDVILGMDWLAPYLAFLDYFSKTMTLASPGMSMIAWKGECYSGPKRIISYVQARKLVESGCLSYLAHIRDTSVVLPPSLDFVCVVHEFIDMFSMDLTGMPLNCDIGFAINVETSTKTISISLYRVAPTKLKEL